MGRTGRKRKRRFSTPRIRGVNPQCSLAPFLQWLLGNGWTPCCNLKPAVFPNSGRGLMALNAVNVGDCLAKIPSKLLMTIKTVSESPIGSALKNSPAKPFITQQVLAYFLAWENHLGELSFWYPYISTLPFSFESPIFCTERQLDCFPPYLVEKIYSMRAYINEMYNHLISVVSKESCYHCEGSLKDIITREVFEWAWFLVNSRSVYMAPEHNSNGSIKLSDDNNLAMAPYLDLFNHTCSAKVKAQFSETDGSYQIKTMVPYKKYDEVFIHYGSHSNTKLLLEYGFIIPNNAHDVIILTPEELFEEVSSCCPGKMDTKNVKYKFLLNHNALSNLYFSSSGLSWNTVIALFVMTSDIVDVKAFQYKAYSAQFSAKELEYVRKVARLLLDKKLIEYTGYINCLKKYISAGSPLDLKVSLCLDLLKELHCVLMRCSVLIDDETSNIFCDA